MTPFGDEVQAAPDPSPAEWIGPALQSSHGLVGSIIPHGFERYARIEHSFGEDDDGSVYEALTGELAALGERHTSTPDQAWFAIWEGYGWSGMPLLWRRNGALGRVTGLLAHRRARRRAERERRALEGQLGAIPTFTVPLRRYYLLSGPVGVASRLVQPGRTGWAQLPDLWWPDDRSWMVATDTDLEWTYVGGTVAFVEALDLLRLAVTPAALDDRMAPQAPPA